MWIDGDEWGRANMSVVNPLFPVLMKGQACFSLHTCCVISFLSFCKFCLLFDYNACSGRHSRNMIQYIHYFANDYIFHYSIILFLVCTDMHLLDGDLFSAVHSPESWSMCWAYLCTQVFREPVACHYKACHDSHVSWEWKRMIWTCSLLGEQCLIKRRNWITSVVCPWRSSTSNAIASETKNQNVISFPMAICIWKTSSSCVIWGAALDLVVKHPKEQLQWNYCKN